MNNFMLGETMEKMRNRISIYLVSKKKKEEKLVVSPTFQSSKEFTKDLVGINPLSVWNGFL